MSDDYEVGYGKPPKEHRFRPGRSGNTRGRPKGTKNLKTDLREELSERITIREGQIVKQVSKQRAWVKSLVARAAQGGQGACTTLVNLWLRVFELDDSSHREHLTREEKDVLDRLFERMSAQVNEDEAGTTRPDAPKGE